MSNQALAWALTARRKDDQPGPCSGPMSASDRLVLVVLADYAHEDGTKAFPSQETIARRVSLSPRTVRRCLKWLEDNGRIARGDQHHVSHYRADARPVVWDLLIDASFADADDTVCPPGQNDRADKSGRAAGQIRSERPDTGVLQPKNITQPQKNPPTPRSADERPHGCDEGWIKLDDGRVDHCPTCRPKARRLRSAS